MGPEKLSALEIDQIRGHGGILKSTTVSLRLGDREVTEMGNTAKKRRFRMESNDFGL